MGIAANPHRGQPALCQAGCPRPALHPYTSRAGRGRKLTHLCLRFSPSGRGFR